MNREQRQIAIINARQLVAGFMPFDELCRQAAHNLKERTEVQDAIRERKQSKQRLNYLNDQLESSMIEKEVLESKHARVVGNVPKRMLSEYQFII